MNKLILGSGFERADLETVVKESSGALFDQAAQHWNHSFYWNSLDPKKVALDEKGSLADAVRRSFGSLNELKAAFEKSGTELFGSGWLWLTSNPEGDLSLVKTKNAMNPLRGQSAPLFTCDLWEHSYYLDYQNLRAKYLSGFFEIINWSFAESNYLNAVVGKLGLQNPNAEQLER